MSTDDVLRSVDELLEQEAYWREYAERNWEQEAMRWTDSLPEENPTSPLRYMRDSVEVVLTVDTSEYLAALGEASRRMSSGFIRMWESFRPFADAMGKLLERMAAHVSPYDAHHPEPLTFHGQPFGAEYARRRKAKGPSWLRLAYRCRASCDGASPCWV